MTLDFLGPPKRNHRLIVSFVALVAAAIFVADLTVPDSYDVWVLYLPLCALTAWFGHPRAAIIVSTLTTLLIAIGWLISPEPPPILPGIVGRLLEVATSWLAVVLILNYQRLASADLALQSARGATDRLSGIIINNTEDAIICIDGDQTITLFNGGAQRVFGYRAGEVLGQNLRLLLPERAIQLHTTYVRDFASSPAQSRLMGERGAVAGRRKDGSEFPAEVSISKFAMPEGITYTAILRDVSARVAADQLLRDREQRLSMALEVGQMGVFQNDEARGTVDMDATARTLLDWPPDETRASALLERIHPDDREAVVARIEGARRNGGSESFEFRVRLGGGRYRWIQLHGVVHLDAVGRPLRSIGIVRDVTDRRNIEQALEARVAERAASLKEEVERREEAQSELLRSQKLQAVGELAGGMAHDFNNLLTVITGNLELLGFGQLDAKARDLLRRADEAAKMGGRLASRLLIIGRRQRLQPVLLDLNELARSMTDVLRRTLGDQIEIHTEFASDLWPTLADVSEIENAILNLAINARDAMPRGGKLVINTVNKALGPDDVVGETGLKPGDYVMLSVSDTGVGIPPEYLARVFEPYFTTKEAGRGTGLGLSTIYGFAKQSGGHLTIYSEVGKGTSVRLYLPRTSGAVTATESGLSTPDRAAGETVLVVEDNPDVRNVTVKRLDMLGYHVIAAENGPAAVAVLQGDRRIDLVFSDVMMPGGMSGFDLVAWVRTNRPEVKILLTSGFTGEVAQNGEREPGGDVEVLRKPYALSELARAVREALA
jgi:PAS domain S-box-containing protein